METKLFEIRDSATFIPAIGIRIEGNDGYLARRAGFGAPCVYLIHLAGERCAYDPYNWDGGSRTMCVAHQYIEENWATLNSGDVVDVQFILKETAQPKQSEQVTAA